MTPPGKSGSHRRAEAALWRAAKAEGLPHSKTLRECLGRRESRQGLGLRQPFLRRQGYGGQAGALAVVAKRKPGES